MERFVEIVKRHPVWIAAGVLGLIALWYFMAGGTEDAGGYGVVNVGPSAETVNANRDVTIAQMTLNAQAVQGANELELAKIASSMNLGLANVDANSYAAQLNATREITEIQADRDVALSNNNVRGAIEVTKATYTGEMGLATIGATRDVSLAHVNADASRDIANLQKDVAFKMYDTALAIASIPPPIVTPNATTPSTTNVTQLFSVGQSAPALEYKVTGPAGTTTVVTTDPLGLSAANPGQTVIGNGLMLKQSGGVKINTAFK